MPVSDASACRVFDVQRFSIHDGPGIRTTVFLEGCPLRCAWCQNPEGFAGGCARERSPRELVAEVLEDRDYYAVSAGGMTVSGGEPLARLAPVRALLEEAKRHELHTCVQTSGAVAQAHLESVLDLVDLVQFDLKHMDTARHRELTGVGNEQIRRNAVFLVERGAPVQFRMPLVPGVNDGPENLEQLADFLSQLGVRALRIVPYHGLYLRKYAALGLEPRLRGIAAPSDAALLRVTEQLARHDVLVEIDG